MSHLLRCSLDWPDFAGADWPTTVMHAEATDRLHEKQGRSIARWTLTAADGRTLVVFLKRHFVLPKRDSLLAKLFPQRAWSPGLCEWEHLEWAEQEGFLVPRAVAAAEYRRPGLKLQSFLAVEELTGMLPLHEAVPQAFGVLSETNFAGWKRGLFAEVARLARELHRRRYFHKDLYFCHFYIADTDTRLTPEAWQGRVVMIDLHRLARHRLGWEWFASKDLAQLLYSSAVPGVTDTDREAIWHAYRGGDWGTARPTPAWVKPLVDAKAVGYQRHHDRKAARAASVSG